jgi:CO/xanthine dehydrogenase Mo-binding subunit
MGNHAIVGKSIARIDALGKVTGAAKYADDLKFENMLHAKALRSPFPRAKIKDIDLSHVRRVPGIVILTAEDVPGENSVGAMIKDQPILAQKEVNFVGEPILLIGADSVEAAEQAMELIHVQYDPLDPVFDPIIAMQEDAPQIHRDGNLASHLKLRKGDVSKGFETADVIVEGAYRTQRVDHAYLEPEAAVARPEGDGRITVWTCTQYTHYDRKEIARMLGISQNRVRIIQTVTGGAFGGKMGNPYCQCFAALLAYKTGRPAKAVYTREESLVTSSKRHPYSVEYKTGATKGGKLVACEVKMISDTGAYMHVGKGVLLRSLVQAAGPYVVPNVKVDGYLVYTNNPIGGGMRGYGGPQVGFAHELQMDELARLLGMDPIKLRLLNALEVGSETATGQLLEQSVGMKRVLLEVQKVSESITKKRQNTGSSRRSGIGIAAGWHGIGSTRGAFEAVAVLNLIADGSATVICGSVDIGQGSDTVMAQIAAQELGVPVEKIRVVTTDSDTTPDCETTSASRVTYYSGNAVRLAARKVKQMMFQRVSEQLGVEPGELVLKDGTIFAEKSPDMKIPLADALKSHSMQGVSAVGTFFPRTVPLDTETSQGSPYATYTYAGSVAHVEVDDKTGEVDLLKLVSIVDVGKAINPVSVEGQIEGGAVMGIGYALMEEIKTDRGLTLNPNFTDYLVPGQMDIWGLETKIVEENESSGPFGAKGFSEVAVTQIAAAVLNAVNNAVGIRMTEIPATQEKVLNAIMTPPA